MDNKLIIITAKNIDVKTVNKLLLTLRNWEFLSDPLWDDCQILRSSKFTSTDAQEDVPPIQEFSGTEFQGKSIQEIEDLMMSKNNAGLRTSLFLILDDKGVQDETIIVAERVINPANGEPLHLDVFDKARVPWIETHSMWCNLSIGNMPFQSFVVEDPQADGERRWFTYRNMMGEDHYREFIERRNVVLRELRKLDLA